MKIMLSLARRIGGELVISAGNHGRGCRFAVEFSPVVPVSDDISPPVWADMPAFGPSRCHDGNGPLHQQAAVDRWVVQANIERFGALLATETDATKRAMIASLLATEVEKTTAPKTEDGMAPRIILAARSGRAP